MKLTTSKKAMISISVKQKLWPGRWGHASTDIIKKSFPIVNGIGIQQISKLEKCSIFLKNKSKRTPRAAKSQESKSSTDILDVLHTDLQGPMKHKSMNGSKYFIPLLDDGNGISLVRFISSKDEAHNSLK